MNEYVVLQCCIAKSSIFCSIETLPISMSENTHSSRSIAPRCALPCGFTVVNGLLAGCFLGAAERFGRESVVCEGHMELVVSVSATEKWKGGE